MNDYRTKIYLRYHTLHGKNFSGDVSIKNIKKQFVFWKYYFKIFLPSNKDVEILDIGCGNGGFVYWLKEEGYKNVFGIDISAEQLEIAHKLRIENVQQAELKEYLVDKKDAYDVTFARDVIEHFTKEEIFEVLQLIYQSLKSGGTFILQTVNGESPFYGRLAYGDFTHETVLTRSSLAQLFQSAGFKDFKFYPVSPVPKGLISSLRYLLWKGIENCLRIYVAVETGSFSGIFTQNLIAVTKK